jgi:hypothetical protein
MNNPSGCHTSAHEHELQKSSVQLPRIRLLVSAQFR